MASRRRSLSMGMAGEDELREEDVWSVVKERDTSGPEMKFPKSMLPSFSSSSSSSPWHLPRTVIRERSKEGSGAKQSSAPVNVPDWSKIYASKRNSMKKSSHLYYDDDDDDGHDDSTDDDVMVPPHEWVARKLARTRISSFSMCEGIGRTLKGRDLSKVRNAVLTRTGFLE
ncbi:PREDICTED: uncharacterized protein LOC104813134 [Tarenaya hassleriana]|uniref:uncharacterized protein LOC104813134 n=1 Tax=Tarenaya hassleriana TaxID=28532 RepID=UPI00053C51C4|nr:PREDICTED: uncharacterized protein LOC104813134 [Tarenaya hassleriana]